MFKFSYLIYPRQLPITRCANTVYKFKKNEYKKKVFIDLHILLCSCQIGCNQILKMKQKNYLKADQLDLSVGYTFSKFNVWVCNVGMGGEFDSGNNGQGL